VRALSSHGKSAPYAPKQIQKHSFQKKAAQLAKQSAYVFHAMFVHNVWNMHWHTMNVSVFGVDSPNANAVV
jgi:RsiW-degrading membrane proteinase PrsW (M82 family)